MTLATLPDLSKITSLMSPIFSFASLYTSTWTSLDARHSPSLCVGSTGGRSLLVYGCLRRRRANHRGGSQECYCKKLGNHDVPPLFGEQLCGRTLVPAA